MVWCCFSVFNSANLGLLQALSTVKRPPTLRRGGFGGSERSNGSPHSSPYIRGGVETPSIYRVSFNSPYISNHTVSS